MRATFTFTDELFRASAEAAWVFVSLPAHQADEILQLVPDRRGFGSVRVAARIGSTKWQTSIFPSKELQSYVLPVKHAVREAEHLDVSDVVTVTITLHVS